MTDDDDDEDDDDDDEEEEYCITLHLVGYTSHILTKQGPLT